MTDKLTKQTQTSELSTDLSVITAEINAYKRVAGEAIFEIGRRLKHVKENDLAHGEWLKWLDSVGIHERQARRLMKVASEFGNEKRTTWSDLPFRALYEIATLPPEERERPHTIPSTGATKTVDEMTVRELREVKAELKRQKEEAAKYHKQALQAEIRAQEAEARAQETLQAEMERVKKQIADLETAKSDMMRKMDASISLSELYVDIEDMLKRKLAPIRYSRALTEAREHPVVLDNLAGIIEMVRDWANEMASYLPSKNYIDAEVVEYEH